MKAGRGIVHSERTDEARRRTGQRLFGIQTWVALPEAQEESDPGFAHHGAAELPVIDGATLTRLDDHTLELDMPRAMDLNRVFDALGAVGIRVRSMRTKSNRLEELFVRLIARPEDAA